MTASTPPDEPAPGPPTPGEWAPASGAPPSAEVDVMGGPVPRATWRRFVVGALAAAAVLVMAVMALNLVTDPWGVFGIGLFPPKVNQDRSAKADLLKGLPEPPQLLIYGSSRAWTVEASRAQKATGLRTFNAAVTAGRPADAYVFTSFVHDIWPQATPDYLWLLDVEAFLRGPLAPSLLAESRFSRYLPWRAKAAAQLDELGWLASWKGLQASYGVWRTHPSWAKVRANWRERIAADGTVSTAAASEAKVNAKRLKRWSAEGVTQYRSFARLDPEAETYMEKTLALFASWGGKGVVVLTPTQPQVLAAEQAAGWQARHADTMRLLRRLQQQYHFAIVDLTSVSAFGGDPGGFFDATHMTRENQRKMLAAVLAAPGVGLH